jgi:hypothetical protein
MIGSLEHEVRVQWNSGDFCDRLHDGRTKRNIIDEMAIHHVQMQPIRASFLNSLALRPKIVEIRCEYRGINDYRFAVHRFFLLFSL